MTPMKCHMCEQAGRQSRFYPPTAYYSTALGGSEFYYDEEGHHHTHQVNRRGGRAHCSEGHAFNLILSNKCLAPGCDFGYEQQIEVVR